MKSEIKIKKEKNRNVFFQKKQTTFVQKNYTKPIVRAKSALSNTKSTPVNEKYEYS